MTELSLAEGDIEDVTDEPAQRTYLRNLLVATADRTGFIGPVLGPEVNANVERIGLAGLALADANGQILVATPEMPPGDEKLRALLRETPQGERGMRDIYAGAAGHPSIAFIAPIFMLQREGDPAAQIGHVIGIKLVEEELYDRLIQPGTTEASAEALLVRETPSTVEYLSPQADGTAPLKRSLALDTTDLASAYAIEKPGGFGLKQDYRGDREVLITSRAVSLAPWTLLYKIDRDEAMAESDSRRDAIIITFILVIAVVGTALLAVWYMASSARATDMVANLKDLALRFERQQNFLRLVTDSQPNEIAIIDESSTYRFGNKKVADHAGIQTHEVRGKTLAAMVGPVRAKVVEKLNREAMAEGETITDVHREVDPEDIDTFHVIQSEHIPLSETLGMPPGVLLVSEDITEAIREREKRERTMRELVNTLVTVVDRRDPYSAHHSTRTAEVARAIAIDMDLEENLVETAEIAASLMNLGKILVPQELLTADRKLTTEERMLIRNSTLTSADLLEGIDFGGPVAETLGQMLEFVDGSGVPNGLAGDDILKSAQICAVANTFVGLISPRSYREGMDFIKAVDILQGDVDHQFSRGVVAALVSHLENKGGKAEWEHFRVLDEAADTDRDA
ncbi:MAG: PAS domain-containing protein [Rhodospirillaceae bacterium]|jgi:PAS domain S-box-containing protein|nr:PAS domain-containing protein [Rhodospirillaceae bacterium]